MFDVEDYLSTRNEDDLQVVFDERCTPASTMGL